MDREIEHVLCRSHTVRQLIEKLQDCDQDARVLFTCSYGDYHNTAQALPLVEIEKRESSDLHESAYSQSGIALCDNMFRERAKGQFSTYEEPDEPRADEDETVVIISS